jgi:hypothetical protein
MTRPIRNTLLVWGLAGLATVALAQSSKEKPTRSVHGIVTDAQENPIAKAVVQIKHTKNLQVKSFYTDGKGSYRFHGLDPDVDYELKAEFGDAKAGPRTVSSFDSRKEVVINFKLDVKQ